MTFGGAKSFGQKALRSVTWGGRVNRFSKSDTLIFLALREGVGVRRFSKSVTLIFLALREGGRRSDDFRKALRCFF